MKGKIEKTPIVFGPTMPLRRRVLDKSEVEIALGKRYTITVNTVIDGQRQGVRVMGLVHRVELDRDHTHILNISLHLDYDPLLPHPWNKADAAEIPAVMVTAADEEDFARGNPASVVLPRLGIHNPLTIHVEELN